MLPQRGAEALTWKRPEVWPQMIGQTLSHFKIIAKLGEGGATRSGGLRAPRTLRFLVMRLNKGQHIALLLGMAILAILVWIGPVFRLQLLAVAFVTAVVVYLLGKA